MKQYYLSKDKILDTGTLGAVINDFLLDGYVKMKKRYDYYLGKQAITRRVPTDDGKPCNKIVANFVRTIVETYEGYASGVPISYSSENQGFEELMDILKYNDYNKEDSKFFRDGLVFGRAAEIMYIDADKKQRFRTLSPLTIIPVYSDDLDNSLLYVIRFWEQQLANTNEQQYIVEVYDQYEVTTYSSTVGFSSFNYLDRRPHNYNQVPISIFSLNDEEESIADQIFSLQDAYNSLLSDSVDDFDAFCDAYMIIKGMTADDDDIKAMKEHRVLLMDSDASADYLTKDVSTQEVKNLLTTCEDNIRDKAACPNFSSETFDTSSGIAIRFRTMQMENRVSAILNNFKEALQKRIELLAEIIKKVNGEQLWRDIDIMFHRNIPTDLSSIASEINQFRGLVSDETLLAQIPFIDNVQEELERIRLQDESKSSLYSEERLNVVEE